MGSQPIGELNVQIGGDFSKLDADLANSVIAAELGAQKIAEGFSVAAGGADKLDTALEALSAQIAATGGELVAWDKEMATAAASTVAAAGGIDKLAQSAAAATPSVESTAQSTEKLASSVGGIIPQVNDWSEALKLLGFSLSAVGLKAFVVDALEAYAAVEKSTIAIASLTGSAGKAKTAIDDLKALSLSDALSFPELVRAEQRMIAFGFSTEQIPGLLRVVGDTSAAVGINFNQLANVFERVIETGMLQGRQLQQLGINVRDLAASMKVSEAEASAFFKSLDTADRIVALEGALKKYEGTASEVAKSVAGQYENLKTEFTFALQQMGEALAPFGKIAIEVLRDVAVPAFTEVIAHVKELSDTIVELGGVIQTLGAPVVDLTNKVFGLDKTMTDLINGPLKTWLTLPIEAPTKLWGALISAIDTFVNKSQTVLASFENQGNAFASWQSAAHAAEAAMQGLSAGAKNVAEAQEKANEKAITARQTWLELSEAAKTGAVGQDAVTRALRAYQDALDAANPKLQEHKQYWKDLAAVYKNWEGDLKAGTATLANTFTIASDLATSGSRTIIGTFKDQGEAFAAYIKQEAAGMNQQHAAFEVFQRDVKDVYPEITKLATELGHFPTLSEQVAAGLDRIVGNLNKIAKEGGGALDTLITDTTNATSMVTDFEHAVSATGDVLHGMGQAGVSAFQSIDAAIKQANADFKDWAAGVGSFGSQLGILGQQPGKGRRGGPGSTNAQGDFNTGVSLPPHTHLDYSQWGISGAQVVPDNGYYFDINGNVVEADWHILANGGSVPGLTSPGGSAPKPTTAAATAATTTTAALPPQVQYLLSQGFALDQMVTGVDTLTTTLTESSDKIVAAVQTLAPVVDQAAQAITSSSEANTAAYQRMADALTPASAPSAASTGTLAAFQNLGPANRTLNATSASGTPQTININAAPQLGTLLNQVMEELQRMGIRF